MYDFKNMKVGDKFEMISSRDDHRAGTIVEFVRYDCDADPVFRPVNGGSTFWISEGNEARFMRPVVTELTDKWIVWNDIGSEMAIDEAQAKRKAEQLLSRYNRPAYIAQATNRVTKNTVAWLY